MDIVLGIFGFMGGVILLLLNQNKKLRSDKKIADLKIEDSRLEEKGLQIKEEKAKLKKELDSPVEMKHFTDDDIESFWKGRKK